MRPARVWMPLAGLALLAGCNQNMKSQAKYNPLEPSPFFADGRSARPPVPGTVARGLLKDDKHLYAGKVGGAEATVFPFPVTEEVLKRGQERFNIYCAVCHDRAGTGNGMIVQRGFPRPPSFHEDRLRKATPGYFFDVATNGYARMQGYAAQVPVKDRWAIVAYIRALQLSQNASLAEVPDDKRRELENLPQ